MFRFCDFTYSGLIDILVQALVAILWDFFNTLTMFLPIVRVWIGSIVGIYIFKFSVFEKNPICFATDWAHLPPSGHVGVTHSRMR